MTQKKNKLKRWHDNVYNNHTSNLPSSKLRTHQRMSQHYVGDKYKRQKRVDVILKSADYHDTMTRQIILFKETITIKISSILSMKSSLV